MQRRQRLGGVPSALPDSHPGLLLQLLICSFQPHRQALQDQACLGPGARSVHVLLQYISQVELASGHPRSADRSFCLSGFTWRYAMGRIAGYEPHPTLARRSS